MSILDIRDLRVSYPGPAGPLPAVRGVDLSVGPGEVVGLAGESGCGKSTVAMSVLRLLPAGATTSGEIRLDGEDVLAMSWGRLRAVRWSTASIVFQGAMHALNPVRTVGYQIAEALALHESGGRRQRSDRVGQLLEQVGLTRDHESRYPHELSGGQRQRVMIAMALACSPALIIADEPTTALDVMVQAQVLELLASLVRDHNMSMVLISHDLSVLASRCDRVAVMYAGRVVEQGRAHTVFAEPAHPYTKALAAAFPIVGDRASRLAPRGLPGDPPDPRDLPTGCSFAPRCSVAVPECSSYETKLSARAGVDGSAACVHIAAAGGDSAGGAASAGAAEVVR